MPTMSPDEFADSIIQDETTRLRGTTAAASKVNPDQQAEYNRVAKTLNMQPIAVEGWEADAKAQAQAVQIDDATQNTPVLRQKFTNDAFAKLAHDDSKPLVTLEGALNFGKNLGKSVRAALPGASAGIVGAAEAFADISDAINPFTYLPQPDYVTKERQAVRQGLTDYRKYLETSAAQIRPVGAPGLEAGVYSGVESFTRNVVNLPLLLVPGGQEAYLASMITPVAGASYVQAKDQGLNLIQSLTFAGAQGGTEYITERLPALDLLKNLKAGAPALKTFLDNMVQEQVGEQIATAVQDFNEWAILPENKDKPFWDYLKARPNAALETAVATAIGSGGQVAVATTANAVMQRMQGRQQDAQDANATAQALDRVAEFAQASKLRDRSPETFKDYVREVSQDGPVQDVYVSGEVLNQVLEAQGVTRQDLEAASPSIAEQLATAVATGGDVRIPVEDFATHLSAPELYQGLADHLKTEPEGMTRTEANEYLQANVETMKAEFDKALASKQGDEAFKASASKVETDILASLEAAGRFTPDVNQQYATLASKVLAVQAARIGITPEEMHARYPVSFAARGGMVGSAMFDQAGNVQTDSPAFKAFYGASVLKDEGGTPQVLYHGTKDTVTAFDLDHPNRKDAGWLGTGVYMTNDPKLANMYAKMKKGGYEDGKVMELYARLENPYMATMEDKQRLRGLGREGADAFTEELKAQGHDGAILTYPDGTQEVVVFDPAAVKSKQNSGTWSRETANIYEQAPVIEGQSQGEGNKQGLMPHLRVDAGVEIPKGKKALFAQTTMNSTATRQIAAIDEVLGRHPDATASPENWNAMMADALASNDVPVPPYAFIANINGTGAEDLLATLTPGQIEDADHGFANAAGFRDDYVNGRISIQDTGKLFLWSFLSRGVSPYTQESLFIDSFDGIGQWIDAAANGTLESRIDEFSAWAATAAPKGSGQPGAGATHNLNAFGKTFLVKMSQDAGDGSGRSRLQVLHDMMSDPNTTGKEVRRKFLEMGEGVGIDNKVVSFTLLVAGYGDVMVLDRVQIRELWNDGRFDGVNLYDGYKEDGKPVAGSALSSLTYGARGLLIYEAIEQGLQAKINGIYENLGRPEAASVGRYHWETWVASSNQEASHATIDAILAAARGSEAPMLGVTAKEGEYGAYAYGARYGRDGKGDPYFLYSVPGKADFKFTVDQFRAFLDGMKVRENGIIPAKFKVTESGNRPWYYREGVNLDNLAKLADEIGEKYEPDTLSEADAAAGIDAPITNRLAADQAGNLRQDATGAAAPTGAAAAGDRLAQTGTPEFKAWFGNSQVVDDTGAPVVVHHATDAVDFDVFDTSDFGSWFAEDISTTTPYRERGRGGKPRVYDVYLKIENPFIIPEGLDLSQDTDLQTALDTVNALNGTNLTAQDLRMPEGYSGTGYEYFGQNDRFAEAVRAAGFDGVRAYEDGKLTWAALSPEQIKSATGNTGAFNPAEAGVYNQTATTPVFFSALARAVENSQTKSATAEQWKATLLKTPGVKQEEMQWTGLFDLFSDPKEKIDRELILAFLNSNGVQLGEVLQETPQLNTGSPYYQIHSFINAIEGATTREDMVQQLENSGEAYQYAGRTQGLQDEDGSLLGVWAELIVDDLLEGSELSNNPVQFSRYKMSGADESYKELLLTLPAVRGPSTHWDEESVVAHARITERTTPEGERVLFLEEVQSDWHQKGRDQGYAGGYTDEQMAEARSAYDQAMARKQETDNRFVALVRQALLDMADLTDNTGREDFEASFGRAPNEDENYRGKVPAATLRERADSLNPDLPNFRLQQAFNAADYYNVPTNGDDALGAAYSELSQQNLRLQEASLKVNNLGSGIPDAPFRKTWAALTMKRLLRYAVDNGFSKVAWINGNQQNGGITGGDGSFFYERNLVNVTNDLVKKYGTKVEQTVRMEGINTETIEAEILQEARAEYEMMTNVLRNSRISFTNPLNGEQELRDRAAELRAAGALARADALEASIPQVRYWLWTRAELEKVEALALKREYAAPANFGFDITPELAAFASGGMPLFQGQEARGTYNPGTHQIALNKNADLSTALHELGHFHLEVLADLASKPDAPADIVADMNTVLTWFGEDMTLDSWQAMSLDQKRPYHETFARGFEAYLFEGKAPTEELRGVFQRFRSWLLAVYRDISKLNVELSDEVRSVFDRLVASNEEIVAAQEARAYAPMFDTKPPFMSDEDWIAYQRADPTATQDAIDTLQTRSLRDMRWLASAKARVLRELQAASRDARKAVKAEVTAEVMAEKVNVARTFLRTGLDQDGEKVEGPHKLDRAAVTALYSDMPAELVDLSALGKGRYGMMADNGLHPDIAAEALGYGSGTELVEDLLNAESSTDKINGMTDQRMLERYGDLTDADAMSRAADEAVHNDARLRFVATELSALEKATGGRKLMASAARGFAKEMVSRLLLRNLRPAQYTAAETRAARAADKALKDGDLVAAATQKRNQLINAHSARAVYKAKAEVEKGMNLFKRIVSAKDEALSRNRNMDLVNASRAILAVYGIGRAKNTPAAYMEKIARYDPVLYADLKLFVDAATQDVPKSGDIRDISLEQFIGLRDTINQMWTMAKRVKEIEIDGKREALADVTATLKDELLVKGVGKFAGMGTQRAVTEGEKKLIGFLGAVALLRRVEEWSKMQGASFERYIYGLVQTSAEKYRAAKIDILPRYRSMIAEIETDLKPFKIYSPELGYTFGEGNGGIGLAELLGAMRHTGNESNLTKLLVGRGWGQFLEDGSLDTSAWDAFINRMMDEGMLKARHFDFLQAEWDLHEEIKPLAQKAHHEVYGRYFNEVTANPISNRFGSYRGGYVAASPDTLLVSEAAQRADAEAMFGGGSALFPAPASGFTKGRIENYTVPLALDLRLAPQQIDKVLRFAYLASPIRDVLRILKDRGFAPVLASHDPVAITDLLMPWLERSASQSVSAPARGQGGKTVDAFARAVRSRTSAALLFANLSNTVQNVTGLAPAALRAGKGNIVRSMWAYLRDPMGSAEAVDSASLMMRNRADTQLDDMRQVLEEIVLNPNAYEKVQTFFSRHAQFMQIGLQNVLDRVVWMAAYDKAVADNEQDPVRFADSVVRTTMGSFTPEDATRFESGPTWARPLTLFAGYFIGQANLLGTEFAKANAAKKWGRGLEVYALGVAIPAIAAQVIAMAFRGDSGDGDDDGLDMGDIFKIFFGSQFGYMAAMVPVIGPVVNSALNRFNDKPYDDKISLSPVASMVEAAAGVPKDLHDLFTDKANWSRTIKDVATAATLATGIPFTLAAKPISYIAGVAEGRIEPTGPADVARGLVTGVASPQSKQP